MAVVVIVAALVIILSGGDDDSSSVGDREGLVEDPEERTNAAEVAVVRSFLEVASRGDCDAALAMMGRQFLDGMTAFDNSRRTAGQSANAKEVFCFSINRYREQLQKGLQVGTVEKTFVGTSGTQVDVEFIDASGTSKTNLFVCSFEDGRWKIAFQELPT